MARKKKITRQQQVRRISPLGGKARMASMSKRERSQFAAVGGRVGGKARAENLSAERRREIARAAARARWSKA